MAAPPPELNRTLMPPSGPVIDSPVCSLAFPIIIIIILISCMVIPCGVMKRRRWLLGRNRIRLSGTSAGTESLCFALYPPHPPPLPVWVTLFSTSFIIFVLSSLEPLKTENADEWNTWMQEWRERDDRWVPHRPLWSAAMKCCFVFCWVTCRFAQGLLTRETLKKCLSRKHGFSNNSTSGYGF